MVTGGVCVRCAGIRPVKRGKRHDFTCERPTKKRLRSSRSMYSNSLRWTFHSSAEVNEFASIQDEATRRLSGPSSAIPANMAKQKTTVDS